VTVNSKEEKLLRLLFGFRPRIRHLDCCCFCTGTVSDTDNSVISCLLLSLLVYYLVWRHQRAWFQTEARVQLSTSASRRWGGAHLPSLNTRIKKFFVTRYSVTRQSVYSFNYNLCPGPKRMPNSMQCYGMRIRILLSSNKNSKEYLDSYCIVTSLWLFIFEKWCKICIFKNEISRIP